jgi:hypothetical protein
MHEFLSNPQEFLGIPKNSERVHKNSIGILRNHKN